MNGGDRVSGENTVFLDNSEFIPNHKGLSEKKKKLLRAFLDIAIMVEMTNRTIMGVPDMIAFLKKKYSIQISAGTIYPIIFKLEKRGYIMRLPRRTKKTYTLTTSGKEALKDVQQNVDYLQNFVIALVTNEKFGGI